jgi:hypothetical protein
MTEGATRCATGGRFGIRIWYLFGHWCLVI